VLSTICPSCALLQQHKLFRQSPKSSLCEHWAVVRTANDAPAIDGLVHTVHPIRCRKPSLQVGRQLLETGPCSTAKLFHCQVRGIETEACTSAVELTRSLQYFLLLGTCLSAFSFESNNPDAVLHVDTGTPNRALRCGPSAWSIDVSLTYIKWTWSRSCFGLQLTSVGGRTTHGAQNHVFSTAGCLASQIATPLPEGPLSLRCWSMRFDVHGP
jgi:hypothetical protein